MQDTAWVKGIFWTLNWSSNIGMKKMTYQLDEKGEMRRVNMAQWLTCFLENKIAGDRFHWRLVTLEKKEQDEYRDKDKDFCISTPFLTSRDSWWLATMKHSSSSASSSSFVFSWSQYPPYHHDDQHDDNDDDDLKPHKFPGGQGWWWLHWWLAILQHSSHYHLTPPPIHPPSSWSSSSSSSLAPELSTSLSFSLVSAIIVHYIPDHRIIGSVLKNKEGINCDHGGGDGFSVESAKSFFLFWSWMTMVGQDVVQISPF